MTRQDIIEITSMMDNVIHWLCESEFGILNDYQFDPTDDSYTGFINISVLNVDETHENRYNACLKAFIDNYDLFKPLVEKLGYEVEKLSYDETIIRRVDLTTE